MHDFFKSLKYLNIVLEIFLIVLSVFKVNVVNIFYIMQYYLFAFMYSRYVEAEKKYEFMSLYTHIVFLVYTLILIICYLKM